MGSEYISRKVLDQYFDRFTIKLVRIHERMAKMQVIHDNEMKTMNDMIVRQWEEIASLVHNLDSDAERLDRIEKKG